MKRILLSGADLAMAMLLVLASPTGGCRCGSSSTSPSESATPAPRDDGGVAKARPAIDASVPEDARRYREARRKMGKLPPCDESNDTWPLAAGEGNSVPSRYTCREVRPPSDYVEGWGYKIGWFAVSTDDAQAVARALELDVKTASWNRGIAYAYAGGSTFVTAPIEGWTLVVGSWILEADAQRLESLVVELSSKFGETQAFLTDRYFEYHGFMLAQTGKLVRSLVYDGEKLGLLRDEGARLPLEDEIDRTHVSRIISAGDGVETRHPITIMTPTGSLRTLEPLPHDILAETLIVRLAAKLSLDPTGLSRASVGEGDGWLGSARNLE